MYRSLGALRATPLAHPSALRAARPLSVQNQLAFKRVLSTSIVRLAADGSGPKRTPDKHNNEEQHYTPSASEELKSVGKDLAEMISGKSAKAAENMARANEISGHSHAGSVAADFKTLTTQTFAEVPKPALVFGLAGTLPYLGTSLGTIFLAREASRASQGMNTITGLDLQGALDQLHMVEHVQITYGAIILSFLGAIHWGMEFSKQGGEHGYRRLALGVVPVLFAVPTTFLPHGLALVSQWFGFTGLWLVDQKTSQRGWTTPWYSTYRFYLSIVVGFSIMATFAGTQFYGAGAGASTAVSYPTRSTYSERMSGYKRLDKVKERNHPTSKDAKVGRLEGKVSGDIALEENDDTYVKIVDHKAETEEREQEQAEQEQKKKENAEYQDKRDEHLQDNSPEGMKETAKDRTGANENVKTEDDKADHKGPGGGKENVKGSAKKTDA